MVAVQLVDSLAGTAQQYIRIQGRIRDGRLHIQGRGNPAQGNRQYGVAVDVAAPSFFNEWLDAQEHDLLSMADSSARYVAMQARLDNSLEAVRFQVAGGPDGNRDYGFAFTISRFNSDIQPLVHWLS